MRPYELNNIDAYVPEKCKSAICMHDFKISLKVLPIFEPKTVKIMHTVRYVQNEDFCSIDIIKTLEGQHR